MSADPELRARYEAIRERVGVLRTSQYDLTDACNLRCEGCFYFAGDDRDKTGAAPGLEQFDAFFAGEAARGINYLQLAGAEPALVQDRLAVAARHVGRGTIYTNGTVRIRSEIPYRIHVSLWGMPESSRVFRGADVVGKALRNYQGDRRALFVLTLHAQNVRSAPEVVRMCEDHGVQITFSHFSPTDAYLLRKERRSEPGETHFRFAGGEERFALSHADLEYAHGLIAELTERHPDTVVYSHAFNDWIHRRDGLYVLDPDTGWAMDCGSRVTRRNRHYRSDLRDAGEVKCCTPNLACNECRGYAQSWATMLHRFPRFVETREGFAQWIALWDLWCRLFLVDWEPVT